MQLLMRRPKLHLPIIHANKEARLVTPGRVGGCDVGYLRRDVASRVVFGVDSHKFRQLHEQAIVEFTVSTLYIALNVPAVRAT